MSSRAFDESDPLGPKEVGFDESDANYRRQSFQLDDPSSRLGYASTTTEDVDLDSMESSRNSEPGAETGVKPRGALQTGEQADLLTSRYFGVPANYIAMGCIYGSMSPMLYPIFVNLLDMPSYTVKGALSCMTIWWNLKVVFGAVSDSIPIYGMRRKPYIIGGWSLAVISLMIIIIYGHPQKGDAAWPYILLFSLTNMLYVGADVAMDSYVADLAQREPEETRGKLQSTIYIIRFLTQAVVAAIMAFGFSSKEYGGDFKWGFNLPQYVAILFSISFLSIFPYFKLKEANTFVRKSLRQHFVRLYERIKLNAVWRVIAFSFFVHLFAYFANAAAYDIERQWCKTKPWVDGLFMNVFGYLVMTAGIWMTKRYFLNTSWRKLLTWVIIAMALTTYIPALLIDYAVIRSQFFYVGAPLAHQLVYGIFFVVSAFCAVEVAEPGAEGVMFGLITTVGNLSIPFTNVLSANITSLFHIYSPDRKTLLDTPAAYVNLSLSPSPQP